MNILKRSFVTTFVFLLFTTLSFHYTSIPAVAQISNHVILSRGDEGKKVRFVQRVLNIKITGRYGLNTYEEVKRFQRHRGLPVTGKVDRATMHKLRNYWDNLRQRRQKVYNRVFTITKNQKGDPYVYGADGPAAFDCSGLTRFAWQRGAGKNLYHHATTQYRSSNKLSRSKARPGDLVFFHTNGDIYHAAIYAGKGYIIHASRPGTVVHRAKIWTNSIYFASPFKRFIPRPA